MSSFEDNSSVNVYSVSELTKSVKYILEDQFPLLRVIGEISNFVRHSSGHIYFSLKDADAQIGCVMWRSKNSALMFRPEDGMKVLISGRITVYERQGRYQIDVDGIQAAGRGELQQAFENLKQFLAAEGLFDREIKKPIPAFPGRIGIVTSQTGAAVRDIVSTIGRRFPAVQLILRSVLVQGPGAAEQITAAIEEFNQYGRVDLLIVGRGGGSLEDLWAFNEECVARAIHASSIPVISAVGHEIDFTISDFVADVRAPTPTAAAELAVPDRNELQGTLMQHRHRFYRAVMQLFSVKRDRVERIRGSHALHQPEGIIREYRLRLDDLMRAMQKSAVSRLERLQHATAAFEQSLKNMGPDEVLARGYSITYNDETGEIIHDSRTLQLKTRLRTRFAQGSAVSEICGIYD